MFALQIGEALLLQGNASLSPAQVKLALQSGATYRVAIDVTMDGFERGWAIGNDRARSPDGIIT